MIDGCSTREMGKRRSAIMKSFFAKLLKATGALLTLSDVAKKSLGIVGMK